MLGTINLCLKAATLGSLTAHVGFFYNSLQDKNEHLRSSLKPDPFNEVMITDYGEGLQLSKLTKFICELFWSSELLWPHYNLVTITPLGVILLFTYAPTRPVMDLVGRFSLSASNYNLEPIKMHRIHWLPLTTETSNGMIRSSSPSSSSPSSPSSPSSSSSSDPGVVDSDKELHRRQLRRKNFESREGERKNTRVGGRGGEREGERKREWAVRKRESNEKKYWREREQEKQR